jgi:hypothetical protein
MVNDQLFPRPQRARHRESDMTHHIPRIYYQYSSHVPNNRNDTLHDVQYMYQFNL